jgi:hypothetical protein
MGIPISAMSSYFKYYDDWQSVELECRKCGWKGKFEDGVVGYHGELMDCSCPTCGFFDRPILAMVMYPTLAEMRSSGRTADTQQAERIAQFQHRFDESKLKDKAQLPDIDAPSFKLDWDFLEIEGDHFTVIRYGDRVLFSEHALWEGYERFEEVCKIIREKYGARAVDLVPTPSSELYLYGDVLSSPTVVIEARRRLLGGEEKS